MANLNSVAITGRLVRDVELKTTQSGANITNITLAVNGYKDGDTSYIDCVLFGNTAEIASKYLSKGSHVGISGRLQQRSYEAKDGSKRSVVEVIAPSLELPPKAAGTPQTSSDSVVDSISDEPVDLSEIPF